VDGAHGATPQQTVITPHRVGAARRPVQRVYADEVGQAHLRVRFKSGDGSVVNGIAFRSIGQKLGNA
jgi:hypothetical protein